MIALVVALLVALPRLAIACPACLGQPRSFDATLALVGGLVLLPFGIAFFVIRAIRRLDAE